MLTPLFSVILNMSITASVVILFVLPARRLLKHAPKVFSYALWAVVLFRLLCPFSLSAQFSLLGLFQAPAGETGQMAYLPLPSDPTPQQTPLPAAAPAAEAEEPPAEVPPSQASSTPSPSLMEVASVLWVVGVAAMLVYSLAQLIRLRRRLVGAIPLYGVLRLADHIDTPFVLGLFRPKIYLPSHLSPQEQRYIICHEQQHIRRKDPILRTAAFAALCLHWFNPLVWLAFRLSGRDMEMCCDEGVIRQLGAEVRGDYSTCLLHFSTRGQHSFTAPLAFGEGDTKERIENIMKSRKNLPWAAAVSVALCLLLTACLGANPQAGEEAQDPGTADPTAVSYLSPSGSTLQSQLESHLKLLFNQAYSPYYKDLRYEMSGYQESRDGDAFTATFHWTMYNQDDSGFSSSGEAESNFQLQAAGTWRDGQMALQNIFSDVSVKGPSEYTQPLADLFPNAGGPATLTGQISGYDLTPGARTLSFDPMFLLTAENDTALLQDLGIDSNSLPNGYTFYDLDHQASTYPIADTVRCQTLAADENGQWALQETTLDQLIQTLGTTTFAYDITVEGGQVTAISEHYMP